MKALDSIISQSQSAFVLGRLITDNVVVGFECIHTLNNRRSGKKGLAALKLDMNKTYDRVEWDYIRQMFAKFGFSKKWMELIMNCVETVSYQVLINGIPQEEFKPRRGSGSEIPFPRISSSSVLKGSRLSLKGKNLSLISQVLKLIVTALL